MVSLLLVVVSNILLVVPLGRAVVRSQFWHGKEGMILGFLKIKKWILFLDEGVCDKGSSLSISRSRQRGFRQRQAC